MFIKKLVSENMSLVDYVFRLHQEQKICPDSFVVDLDQTILNAQAILDEAKKYGIRLYFMLKQIGRNPVIAQELMKIGYDGAVAVDFREAEIMIDNNIKIGNVGHIVQIPTCLLRKVISARPEIITVYSLEKIKQINEVAKELNLVQAIMIRMIDDTCTIYDSQVGGFTKEDLPNLADEIKKLSNVRLEGVTSFPCFLFNEKSKQIEALPNAKLVYEAKTIMSNYGFAITNINMPSATCVDSIHKIAAAGGTSAEPGSSFTGQTPLHAIKTQSEKISQCYLTEVSHNYKNKSYCFGGGHYRRSHVANALVGKSASSYKIVGVNPLKEESIDYHFELNQPCFVGDSVIMCYRSQVFVARSDVVIVKGLKTGNPEIVGVYDHLGRKR